MNTRYGRSDRNRTCDIDVPKKYIPIFCLIYKAFRGFLSAVIIAYFKVIVKSLLSTLKICIAVVKENAESLDTDKLREVYKAHEAEIGYPVLSRDYLERAAKHGSSQAQYDLGKILAEEGRQEEAFKYFEAAEHGYEPAVEAVNTIRRH